MLKNNVKVDVKVKCIEGDATQAKLAEDIICKTRGGMTLW